MDDQIREWQAFEKANPITVDASLTDPHPLIWHTAKRLGFALDPATPVPPVDYRWFHISVSPELAERALCIADAFVKACELRGFELRADATKRPDGAVAVVIDGGPVNVRLLERGGWSPYSLAGSVGQLERPHEPPAQPKAQFHPACPPKDGCPIAGAAA